MREYKFRGIDIKTRKFVYGSLVNFSELNGCPQYEIYSIEKITKQQKWHKVYDVGQYTGLKDRNGAEIYEGDIVKCIEVSENNLREYVSEVLFEDGCWLVHESEMCDVELYLYDNSNPTKIPLTEIEVIGNVFENIELLEAN